MPALSTSLFKNPDNKDKRFVALMRPEDIRESVLTTLDITVTVDELRRPTSVLVEQLYMAFLQEIFDVDFDEYMVNMQGQPYFSAVRVLSDPGRQASGCGRVDAFCAIDPCGDVSCNALSPLSQRLVGRYCHYSLC